MIRLLAPYQFYKNNQIVSLAPDWERYLVLAGAASTDLTGGIPYVAPVAPRRLVPASLVVGATGAVLGIEGPGGTLIAVGSSNITAPGAPTGLALTAAAGAVVAAFALPSNTGGSPLTTVTVTLSNGQSGSGLTSPITIATPAGTAVTATAKAANDFFESVASAASNTVTPTGATTPVVATALTLTGPATATVGTASGAFTVALSPAGSTEASPVTVTPTAVAGVTYTPASVTLTTASPSATFTANASTAGTKSIAVTSTGGLSAPAAINLVVAAASSTVNMILWMGQSQSNSNGNTTGGGGATTLAPVTPGLVPNVYIWDTLAKDWIGYNPGVTSSAHLRAGKYSETSNNYWGGEHQLALRWVADNPGVPLYILKKGHSTTSLQQAARSADRGCWDQNLRGDLYDELVTWASEAKAKLTSAGKTVNIQSAHWTQGENDGNITAQVATDYGPALTSFIASLRSAGVITNTTPFIVSRIKTGAWAFANELRAQQQLVAETAPYCRWVDADSVQIDGNDSVHYGPNGVVTHGNLMYDESLDGAGIAREYASRMTTAPTAPRLAALATLFDSLIAARVWSGISSMNLLAAETAQAALVNVRRAGVTPINSGMTFTANQGLTGTSTASFLNTKVNPGTNTKIARGNAAYAFYIRGNSSTTGVDMGYNVTDGSGAATIVGAAQSPGTSGFRINNSNTGASNQPAGVTDVSGLWSASRTALASCTLTQNGVQIGATDTTLTDLAESSTDIFLGNRNSGNNTSGTNGTLRQYSAFVAGTGRTLAQEVALSNAISAYMTAIGA